MYNTEVGYCQGMSQVAALLLMFLSEEVRAFGGYKERLHSYNLKDLRPPLKKVSPVQRVARIKASREAGKSFFFFFFFLYNKRQGKYSEKKEKNL